MRKLADLASEILVEFERTRMVPFDEGYDNNVLAIAHMEDISDRNPMDTTCRVVGLFIEVEEILS